ncbi:MAG: addiction module protein [Chlorobiaceae bacterium]|jgi:putative addiction module component (TIGR02574 family)|nr:addiction module protein [Chlorobiaceae bacterium]
MSENFKNILDNVKQLNPQERALMAHLIIASLEMVADNDVDEVWAELADRRYDDLITGKVKGVTWDDIKQRIQD